jgi:hypothetical protein
MPGGGPIPGGGAPIPGGGPIPGGYRLGSDIVFPCYTNNNKNEKVIDYSKTTVVCSYDLIVSSRFDFRFFVSLPPEQRSAEWLADDVQTDTN